MNFKQTGIFIFFLVLFSGMLAQTPKGSELLPPKSNTGTGNTWAIVVGISEYQNIAKLEYADDDALAFYNYLKTPQVNVPESNIRKLLNKEATASEIYGTLEWLAESVKENDRVLFYFSGHGDVEKKTIHQNGFLLAHDAPTAAYMTKGTISIKFLQDYLETYVVNNKAKDVLLIVDACRSGKLAGGIQGVQMTMQALGTPWSGQITKILSAQEGELSMEAPRWGGGRGVFSYYLMKGIQGLANRNSDSVITTSELAAYLLIVADETESSQNPKVDGDPKHSLFQFDHALLAAAKKESKSDGTIASTKKGIADALPPGVKEDYLKYTELVKKGWLLWGAKEEDTINSALHFYTRLMANAEAAPVVPSLRSSFVASLQKRSQENLDSYLKGQDYKSILDDKRGIREIAYASSLVSEKHILYHYIRARALFFQSLDIKDPLEAIALLKNALVEEEESPYIYNRIGLRYDDARMPDSAIAYYRKALSLSPTWSFPYNNLGIVYWRMKDYDNAILNCKRSIELSPHNASPFNTLGNVYDEMEQYDLAIENYLKSIQYDSTSSYPYNGLGNVYSGQDKNDLALEYYWKAIASDSTDEQPYANIGAVYVTMKRYEEALGMFGKALQIKPCNAQSYNGIGDLYYEKSRYQDALENYLKATECEPDYSIAWDNAGFIYSRTSSGNIEAEKCFLKSIAINPRNSYPFLQLAFIYQYSDKKKALDYCYEALKYNKNSPDVYFKIDQLIADETRGCTYILQGLELKYDQNTAERLLYRDAKIQLNALTLYLDSFRTKSPSLELMNLEGDIYFGNEMFDKALEQYKKVIALDTNKLLAYGAGSMAAMYTKDYDLAEKYFIKLIDTYPDFSDAFYNLACVYSLTNKLEKSLQYLEKAMEKGYDNYQHILDDKDLENLRKSPAFEEFKKTKLPEIKN